MEVYVDDEAKLTLHGLQQHYVKIKENEKNRKLFELLDALEFNQVNLSLFFLFVQYSLNCVCTLLMPTLHIPSLVSIYCTFALLSC